MTPKLIPLALAALTTGCMAERAPPGPMPAEVEAELRAEIGNRVAGAPVPCVRQRDIGGKEVIGDRLIVFEGRTSSTVYVNRPPGSCAGLARGRALVTRTTGPNLCAGDIAEIVDPFNGISAGGCPLGEFTPYRR